MPYEPVTWYLPPEPDGTMRLVSIVPREDRPGADLEWWDVPEKLIDEPPCHLLELPLEVLTNILHQIEDKSDLYALLRAAPSLYNIIIPIWWKHLTINLRNDRYDDSRPTNIPLLLKARSPDLDRLQFVKGIVVKGTSPPLNWCIHRNRIYGKFFENMSKDIAKFLCHLKPNSLKQFIWTSGTCMIDSLIATYGCLSTRQKNLEELKLVMSARCVEQQYSIYLGVFTKLKYLSLRGLKERPRDEYFYPCLEGMLRGPAATLVEFELGVVPNEDEAPYPGILDGKQIFPIPGARPSAKLREFECWFVPGKQKEVPYKSDGQQSLAIDTSAFLFPKLRVLHLEMVSLSGCAARLVQTIDVASMMSLTLRQCEGWDDLCQLMAQGDGPMNLRKLELEFHTAGRKSDDYIIDLLNRCPKIETLAICDGCECSQGVALEMWKSLCYGRPSLRGFVYHQTDFAEKCDCLGPTMDPRGDDYGELFLYKLTECLHSPEANPFTDSNLEFLGICSFPSTMLAGILRSLAEQNRLRIIHFRKSAFEMNAIMSLRRSLDNFVQWAFGLTGIASLEVVLFGDFSAYRVKRGANCRYNRTQGTYPGYDVKVDPDISDLPFRYLSMAKACPSQFIM